MKSMEKMFDLIKNVFVCVCLYRYSLQYMNYYNTLAKN